MYRICGLLWVICVALSTPAVALDLAPQQLLQAGGADIDVPGYSVPFCTDWDGDGRDDLIVGEGGGGVPLGKVRVYLNTGSQAAPTYDGYTYAQAGGIDLSVPASGCLGIFPRSVDWDADERLDLLVGRADGRAMIFLNSSESGAPVLDSGTYVQVGATGSKEDLDVGYRATISGVDWNNDGRLDLISGALDGKVRLYLDANDDGGPDFESATPVQAGGGDLVVPSNRSSPAVADMDGDGKKDILTGNTNGQLLLYRNTGTDEAPVFSSYTSVTAVTGPIDLVGTPRSRPSVTDWNHDGFLDVLIGSSDGMVRLYLGQRPGDADRDSDVDDDDLSLLLSNWDEDVTGDPDGGWGKGEFSGLAPVNDDDLSLLLANWSGPLGGAVPEPASMMLVLLGGSALVRRGRSRK